MKSLLVIDVQNAIVDGTVTVDRQPIIDQALQNTVDRIAILQRQARVAGAPVFVVQHDGAPGHRLARGSQGWEIRREVAPIRGDIVINKPTVMPFTRPILQPSLKCVV